MEGAGGGRRRASAGTLPKFSASGSFYKLQESRTESQNIQSVFTQLDVASKTLLFEANQTLSVYRKRGETGDDPKKAVEEDKRLTELIGTLKLYLEDMKGIAEDMGTIGDGRMSSPRVVDQAKTFILSVDTLKAALRELQIDFQYVKNSKQRQDLFTLSRSPFAPYEVTPLNGGVPKFVRRRKGGATAISASATEGLSVTRKLLMETVDRSADTMGRLAGTSGSIQSNQTELAEQNTHIGMSRKLLGKYGKREYTDKIIICVALIFFLAVVMYVVQKRVF